jgi:hypothetical protein
MITNATHTRGLIRSESSLAVYEITKDADDVQTPKRFYVVWESAPGRVSSIYPDSPSDGGCWTANNTPGGIAYVANGRTRDAAMRMFRKALKEKE